jgi:hypothetical protein
MFVLVRTVAYAALFIGLLLIYLPVCLLLWSGLVRPETCEVQQAVGMVVATAGAAVAETLGAVARWLLTA